MQNIGFDSFTVSLIIVLVVAVGGVVIAAAWDEKARKMSNRLRVIRAIYGGEGTGLKYEEPKKLDDLVKQGKFVIMDGLARISSSAMADNASLQNQLQSLGFEGRYYAQVFTSIKYLWTVVLVVLGALFPLAEKLPFLNGPLGVFATLVLAGLFGLRLPHYLLDYLLVRRHTQVNTTLPDALDLLCICANAGYTIDVALDRVSREMARSAPVVARQFEITSRDLKVLPDRELAFRRLLERVNLPCINSLVTTLIQSQKMGTPITVALKTLAEAERKVRLSSIEERAAKLPAQITVPIMIFILPTIFLIVGGPAAINVSKTIGN